MVLIGFRFELDGILMPSSKKEIVRAMINRKDFVRNCAAAVCATGLCCAMKAPEASAAAAEDAPKTCDPRELTSVRDRADAARLRFSKLIEIMEAKLPTKAVQFLRTL